MRLLSAIVFLGFLFSASLAQSQNVSFESEEQFSEFIDFLNMKNSDGKRFYSRIYMKNLSSSDLENEYTLMPDTAIVLDNHVLLAYDLQQNDPLGRITRQILLYSLNGRFEDVLTIKPFYEDWAEDATYYFYESYVVTNNTLVVSRTRRNHLVVPIVNVPRGENITQSISFYTIGPKFIVDTDKQQYQETGYMYTFESLAPLSRLDKNELRLVRNYFFAKYDFEFSDKELENYYLNHLMYYKPTYKNVSDRLTSNEKMVVNFILRLEAEK
ncbi:YARHG domain-containing protein [uncultured Imperialibacter sp.]|uniref:YARHG domain-containing protein n=1 Tax=uncultured Imperialibacter sp. TaxID=1672639 RepID=UPI0030DDA173|tara:strand:- start:6574 stop:7383 length:810 start_codon:yes stop_codon:yes gene_type:complete